MFGKSNDFTINRLLHKLCKKLVEKDEVAHAYELAQRIMKDAVPSPHSQSNDVLIVEKIKRHFEVAGKDEDLEKFMSLYRKLESSSVLKNLPAILALLDCVGTPVTSDTARQPPLFMDVPQAVPDNVTVRKSLQLDTPSIQRSYSMRSLPANRDESCLLTTPRPQEIAVLQQGLAVAGSPLEVLKSDVGEDELLQELVYAFQGIPGKILQLNAVTQDLKINPIVKLSRGHRHMVLRLAELGWLHNQLRQFCNTSDVSLGLMEKGFLAALRSELTEYYRLVANIETQVQKQTREIVESPLTLRQLLVWALEPIFRLKWLVTIVTACSGRKAGALASCVHGYLQHGNPAVRSTVRHLLSMVCKPVYMMLSRWMLDGELEDPFGEFFIVANVDIKGDRLWHEKYNVQENLVPCFITLAQAKKILATGKSINFLREVCHDYTPVKGREQLRRHLDRTSGEVVTAAKILAHMNENYDTYLYKGSKTSLQRILKDMGFVWSKGDPFAYIRETEVICFKRSCFLREYMRNKDSENPKPVVFLDETWIFMNGSPTYSWNKPQKSGHDVQGVIRRPTSEGGRLVIVHAGTKEGFVPGAGLIFSTNLKRNQDYHGAMNSEKFQTWVETQLIVGLRTIGPCVIVMDNASYHCKLVEQQPTTNWRKDQLVSWLRQNGVSPPENATKAELQRLCHMNRSHLKRYVVDEMLRNEGHTVLRLPPYHSFFNAIELVWSVAKQYYNKTVASRPGHGLDRARAVWKESLDQVTADIWRNEVKHAEQKIVEFYNNEVRDVPEVEELVIHHGSSESEEEEVGEEQEEGRTEEAEEELAVKLPELQKPASQLYPHVLSGILESAIRSTNAQFENPDILERLDLRLLETSPGDTGWDVFSLDYHVNGPIGTIFGPAATSYLMLFNALWRSKRMEYVLTASWKRQVTSAKMLRKLPELTPLLQHTHLLTAEMIHFVHQMQYYMLFEVLECSWHALIWDVQHAEALDDIIRAHNSFLTRIKKGALLDNDSQELSAQLRAVYDLILQLQRLEDQLHTRSLEELNARANRETTVEQRGEAGQFGTSLAEEEALAAERRNFVDVYLPYVHAQLRVLAKSYQDVVKKFLLLLASHSDVSLQLLSVRLDFNEHYKRTDARLAAPYTYRRLSELAYKPPSYCK